MNDYYRPQHALVWYKNEVQENYYVEKYDLDDYGNPVNAHPLSINEASILAQTLDMEREQEAGFLKPAGLLPENLLYLNPSPAHPMVIWHTPPERRPLFFVSDLGISSGRAFLPPLLWMATKEQLRLFALKTDQKPTLSTSLCHAPFFNMYTDGAVCMGTVHIEWQQQSLEGFMEGWETYFFNSYFSHLIDGHNPVKGNAVQFWKTLIVSGKSFPVEMLIKTRFTLKKLIV